MPQRLEQRDRKTDGQTRGHSPWPGSVELALYEQLSRLPWPSSYLGKIVAVAFLGTHVPLIALVVYFVVTSAIATELALTILAVTLAATLVCTGLSIFLLMVLLSPIVRTTDDLRHFMSSRQLRLDDAVPRNMVEQLTQAVAILTTTVERQRGLLEDPLAGTDFLTATLDRRAGELRLLASLEALEPGQDFTLVLIDLDRLKGLNDTYGHSFGDASLAHLVHCVQSYVRVGRDWVARWGGDEFVIGLMTERRTVPRIMGRLYRGLSRSPLAAPDGGPVILTISAGVAVATAGDDPAALFERADQALYTAKREGRGRFVVAGPR